MKTVAHRQLIDFSRHVLLRFHHDRCLQLASSLTFTTLLALVPLLTVTLTVASAFPGFSGVTGQIDDFVASHVLPQQISKTVLRYVDEFSRRAGSLTLIGLSVLAAVSFITMLTIERAFDVIWGSKTHRPMLQRIVIYWGILTLGPVLIGISLSMTSYLVSTSMGLARSVPMLGVIALWLVPFALTVGAFTLLYYVVPSRPVELRHAVIGGITAGVLFELAKRGFALYVSKVPAYTVVYGTFATFPIFLIWIHLSWVVTVLGAVVAAALPDFGNVEQSGHRLAGAQFADALCLLLGLGAGHARGQVLDVAALAQRSGLTQQRCENFMGTFATAGWAARVDSGRWALICDPGAIALKEVSRLFLLTPGAWSRNAAPPALIRLLEELDDSVERALSMSLRDLMAKDGSAEAVLPAPVGGKSSQAIR